MKTLRIGTRGSTLALWQANTVARLISERGGPPCDLVIIRTSADESSGPPDQPRASIKAGFVKEIEDALLTGAIDLAVHSSKDLAADLPGGLTIGAALEREDPRDVALLPNGDSVSTFEALSERLGSQPRFGTSSVRRAAQLAMLFPRATFVPLRGNVDTRIRKLDAGDCDAAVLASAGLKRLGVAHRISFAFDIDLCIPAPGQGIVAVEIPDKHADAARAAALINDAAAMDALTAERAIVRALGGGCQMPLGAHARIEGSDVCITATVLTPDGRRHARAEARGARTNAATVGEAIAASLLTRGARDILGL